MTRRLLVTYLTITLFGLALFGIPLGLTFAHRERDRLLFEIERDADVMATSMPVPTGHIFDYARQNGGRVVVVDAKGRSTLDTDAPNGPPADFSTRPEIQDALSGKRVDGTRYSNTLHTDLLYVAVPRTENGRVSGAVRITYPTATLNARVRRAWAQLTLLGLGVLVAVALVAFLVARSLARPMRRLEEATDRLASGELETRADEAYGPQELRHLALTFNRMATRVTHVLDAEKRFVADASHQLRTPRTALRLRLENLETTTPQPQRPAIDAAIAELDRLGRLVDALLTLERGDAEMSTAVATDVAEVVRDRAEAWHELVEARHVALAVETPDHAWARALPGALEQVVDNLLDNALEVSTPNATVTVRVARAPSGVEVHVVDEGPGLDAESRLQAFDRFWRATQSSAGSGLGLAIVRRLAEASGGSARLDVAATGGVDAVVVLPPSPPPSGIAADTASFALS
ncbi:MAG TPA: ATP-binding protein [Acidimicrobiia bacterium]|nr:ATP-binding protein [Acidimicrobiia bacterium]